MLQPPSTAPVRAILATLILDGVGLRWRPLIRAEISSLETRLRGQLSGSGWRGHPAGVFSTWEVTSASPLGTASGPSSDHGGPVGAPSPSRFGFPRLLDGARRDREGRNAVQDQRAFGDASGFCWSRHVERNAAFPPRSSAKTPGTPGHCAGHTMRDRSVSALL